jgi:hypothetical protein
MKQNLFTDMTFKRTDDNQKSVVTALRKIPNLSVTSSHTIGKGFPDLVIGYKGNNYLIELKDGAKTKSQKKLTIAEVKFHDEWNGQVAICESVEEIFKIILCKE